MNVSGCSLQPKRQPIEVPKPPVSEDVQKRIVTRVPSTLTEDPGPPQLSKPPLIIYNQPATLGPAFDAHEGNLARLLGYIDNLRLRLAIIRRDYGESKVGTPDAK